MRLDYHRLRSGTTGIGNMRTGTNRLEDQKSCQEDWEGKNAQVIVNVEEINLKKCPFIPSKPAILKLSEKEIS
jgi:hypothetical protein